MEELRNRHRKEQKDLQSQVTQKKKSASKKTRKGVNDECATLERELKERHDLEVHQILGLDDGNGAQEPTVNGNGTAEDDGQDDDELLASITQSASLNPARGDQTANDFQDDTSNSTPRKPNRAKARLAKRKEAQDAAVLQGNDEAAKMPDKKTQERNRMLEEFKKRGLKEKVVAANGHCLYSAVADQMRILGLELDQSAGLEDAEAAKEDGVRNDDYKAVRRRAAAFISENSEDFVPFLEEPLDDYVQKIRDTGEWGGQLELMALAKTYNLKIHVLQGDGRVEDIESGTSESKGDVWLAYYRHGFGLGEHYNSLRRMVSEG